LVYGIVTKGLPESVVGSGKITLTREELMELLAQAMDRKS